MAVLAHEPHPGAEAPPAEPLLPEDRQALVAALPFLQALYRLNRRDGKRMFGILPNGSPFPNEFFDLKPYGYKKGDSKELSTWQMTLGDRFSGRFDTVGTMTSQRKEGIDFTFTMKEDGVTRDATSEEFHNLATLLTYLHTTRPEVIEMAKSKPPLYKRIARRIGATSLKPHTA